MAGVFVVIFNLLCFLSFNEKKKQVTILLISTK